MKDLKNGIIAGLLIVLCMSIYAWKTTEDMLNYRRSQYDSQRVQIQELKKEVKDLQNEIETLQNNPV